MNETVLTALFIALVLIMAIGLWLTMRKKRTEHLRDRFGDEYDRTVDDRGGRTKAEKALEEREERVNALEIRPLTSDEHRKFADEWKDVKSIFVDSPTEAVHHADRMLGNMMRAKGFPMADFDTRYEDLTVNHGDVARHYRDGHQIIEQHDAGNASTEDLRQSMKHFEALYDRLVSDADREGHMASSRGASGHDLDGDGDVDVVRQDADGDGRPDHITHRPG